MQCRPFIRSHGLISSPTPTSQQERFFFFISKKSIMWSAAFGASEQNTQEKQRGTVGNIHIQFLYIIYRVAQEQWNRMPAEIRML